MIAKFQTPMKNEYLINLRSNPVELGELSHHVFMMQSVDKKKIHYRAFCGGSIIKNNRVLSSAHCFYTNRKRLKGKMSAIRVVGGIIETSTEYSGNDGVQQWRTVKKIFTQKFFRFPAYNLAVVQLKKPWEFNQYINKIPYASLNQNFDGICVVTIVHPARSWATKKYLFSETFNMLRRSECESRLLRSLRLYYCTDYDSRKLILQSVESEGGGLVCKGTGDPEETDVKQGLLVGVTSLIYMYLPTLHHRVAPFNQWVSDSCKSFTEISNGMLLLFIAIKLL